MSSSRGRKPGSWVPVAISEAHGDRCSSSFWRSFEHLETYARSRDAAHWPAWVDFNKRVGSSGDVGIWHEAYLVPAGAYECVYNNMPPTGLGTVATLVPAAGRKATAASRAGIREEACSRSWN